MQDPAKLPSNWDDLTIRMVSSVAMTVVGAAAVVMGGVWFQMLAVFVTAVMVWELWMMICPKEPTKGMLMAALVASIMSGSIAEPSLWSLAFFLIVPAIGVTQLRTERKTFFLFALAIQFAGWGLVHFRLDYGFLWLLWLMSVVIITDVFGYFAGKAFGGPKFWPKISPKKTWSGTVAGWAGAALIGGFFMALTDAGIWIIGVSVVLSFAGQMGDIAESALKRRMGVKDSSTLIPGHGGLFDRFDALLGASLFMLVLVDVVRLPGMAF